MHVAPVYVAPTCESRFKAPVHTAQAGEAAPFPGRLDAVRERGPERVISFFIHGPDSTLAPEAVLKNGTAAEFDPSGSNTTWLDGRETSFGGVRVGRRRRFVLRLIRHCDRRRRILFWSGQPGIGVRGVNSLESKNELGMRTRRRIQPLVWAVPSHIFLTIFEPTLTSVPAMLKTAAPGLKVIAGEPPRGPALDRWRFEATAQGAESRIDRRTAQRLAETLIRRRGKRKPSNPR